MRVVLTRRAVAHTNAVGACGAGSRHRHAHWCARPYHNAMQPRLACAHAWSAGALAHGCCTNSARAGERRGGGERGGVCVCVSRWPVTYKEGGSMGCELRAGLRLPTTGKSQNYHSQDYLLTIKTRVDLVKRKAKTKLKKMNKDFRKDSRAQKLVIRT